jgi:hypothetical protein
VEREAKGTAETNANAGKTRTAVAKALLFLLFAIGIVVIFYLSPASVLGLLDMEPLQEGQPWLTLADTPMTLAPLDEGDVVLALISGTFSRSFGVNVESQIVAHRNALEAESPIHVTFISFDEVLASHRRFWSTETIATNHISLQTLDMLGDHSTSILLSGLSDSGEHTLSVFRKNPLPLGEGEEPFSILAELVADGSIVISDMGEGESHRIRALSRDPASANILDQIELVFAYNPATRLYEELSRMRIPGAQVEGQRVAEILANAGAFERFAAGLWYLAAPEGGIDYSQYVYFDPIAREIIFSAGGSQQIFRWQNSSLTRNGISISSQNLLVSTLRRIVDVELESLDSIRLRVLEDLRSHTWGNTHWDGSYRKALIFEGPVPASPFTGGTFVEASFDSALLGHLDFFPEGTLRQSVRGEERLGRYAFFYLGGQRYLEMSFSQQGATTESREIFSVQNTESENIILYRVRIGVHGIESQGDFPLLLLKLESSQGLSR